MFCHTITQGFGNFFIGWYFPITAEQSSLISHRLFKISLGFTPWAWVSYRTESDILARTVWAERVPQPNDSVWWRRNPEGHGQVDMVLGPFAEQRWRPAGRTKQQARLRGRTPHLPVQPFPKQAIRIDRPEWFTMLAPMTVFIQKLVDVFCSSHNRVFFWQGQKIIWQGMGSFFSFDMVSFIHEGQGESHA